MRQDLTGIPGSSRRGEHPLQSGWAIARMCHTAYAIVSLLITDDWMAESGKAAKRRGGRGKFRDKEPKATKPPRLWAPPFPYIGCQTGCSSTKPFRPDLQVTLEAYGSRLFEFVTLSVAQPPGTRSSQTEFGGNRKLTSNWL